MPEMNVIDCKGKTCSHTLAHTRTYTHIDSYSQNGSAAHNLMRIHETLQQQQEKKKKEKRRKNKTKMEKKTKWGS